MLIKHVANMNPKETIAHKYIRKVKRDIGKAVEGMEPVHEVYVSKSVGSKRDAEEGDNFVRRILDNGIGRSPLCS